MKNLILIMLVLVGLTFSDAYIDTTSSGTYIKAFSPEGGIGLITLDKELTAFVTAIQPEKNNNGVLILLIKNSSDYDDSQLFELTYASKITDEDGTMMFLYDITNDYGLINMMKRLPELDILILNEPYGGDDGIWGQTISTFGYKQLYKQLYE